MSTNSIFIMNKFIISLEYADNPIHEISKNKRKNKNYKEDKF